jgi:hypothetical protein
MKLLPLLLLLTATAMAAPQAWPEATSTNKPWARWWWLGSAVDKENITRLLEQYQKAGFGGVEICPIYGAKGAEDRFIDFLSPKWMEMLAHTTSEAKRLGMQVDLTTGTGWPFGGPNVSANEASAKVVLKAYDVAAGKKFDEKLPDGTLRCLRAVSEAGEQVDLTDKRDWTPPAGKWRVYALLQVAPIQKVKRAAPGGAGNVLDPYSVKAMESYLSAFDKAFEGFSAPMPRCEFHDSFEYYGATWTNDLLDQFQKRRGYDLRTQLPALNGEGDKETVARVKHDYRETLSDLHLAYVQRWTKWSHDHGSQSRNQAHGAPGNLIDLYAAADIPECEIFGQVDERDIPMLKFASSAAHVSGRNLASSESFTWLGEHFSVSLADLKPAADLLFLSGINHILYHGVPYSPKDVEWPGWLFYAAVNFGPNGGLWHDLPAFNAYVARVQSVLQSGKSDNDVLLYWPIHDSWQTDGGNLLMQFTVHDQSKWLWTTHFYKTAMHLQDRGFTWDAISDALLSAAKAADGKIAVNGVSYRSIVVPSCKVMPLETRSKLAELAQAGAAVIVLDALPEDVPGLANFRERRAQLGKIEKATVGESEKIDAFLQIAKVPRESMVDAGLRFVRRASDKGRDYFIVNRGDRSINSWIPLSTPAASAELLDPRFLNRSGMAALRQQGGLTEVYLQLQPGESCIVRTATDAQPGAAWSYAQPAGEARIIDGVWKVHFIEGGPALPADYRSNELASWTSCKDPEAKRFAGTARYTIQIDHLDDPSATDWLLDLGRICDSARVTINGEEIATLWCKPFAVRLGRYMGPGRKTLGIEVTNVAANRIADLDRRHVPWKAFHEINFVNKGYKPFDASNWPLRDSGLLGPVTLTPLKTITP